jgi:hypothetical protein
VRTVACTTHRGIHERLNPADPPRANNAILTTTNK